jgi:hypothetical protein
MKKFQVIIRQRVLEEMVLTVEAEDELQAEELAFEIGENTPDSEKWKCIGIEPCQIVEIRSE